MMTFKLRTAKQLMKNLNKSGVFLSLLCSLSITASTSLNAAEQSLDGIAAVVNSDVIMVSELRVAAIRFQSQQENKLSEKQLYKEVLENLIMGKIQVQKAKSIGIKIDDAAVDTALESIAKQNNLDLQELRLAIIERGLDYKEFRESIRDRLFTETLRRRQQGRNNDIADNEIDDMIQSESFNLSKDIQYQLIDITIPNNTNSVKQFNKNLKNAQNLRNKLLLNKSLSSPEMIKLGATKKDLGWMNAEALSPAYSRILSLMGEGELSTVIRDTKGFHILKLVKQRGGKRQQIQEAKARHILINNKDPQAKVKVTQLRNKILAGESFTKLASKHSDDVGSAKKGGVLPMTNTTNYVPPFAKAVNTLAINTVSQPIETKFGWHIIEVLERKSSDKTRESIKTKAKQLMSSRKRDDNLNNWLKTLRDEAFVEYRLKP